MSKMNDIVDRFRRKTMIVRRELRVRDGGKAHLLIMCHKIISVEYKLVLDHHCALPSCAPQQDPEVEVENTRHAGQPCLKVTWKHMPPKSILEFEVKCLA